MRPAPFLSSPDDPDVDAARSDQADELDAGNSVATRRRGAVRAVVGLAISAVFLVVAFRGQDFGEVRDALGRTEYRWLAPALALYGTGVWIRAIRWSVLLRPIVAVRARDVFPLVIVGYTANNVLPLRTGELVRAYLLGQRHGVRKTAALATVAIERLFDGLTMLAFMLIAATAISFTAELRRIAVVAVALFALALAGLLVLLLGTEPRERVLRLVLGPLPVGIAVRVERMARSFLTGLGALTRRSDLALVAGTSLVAWCCEAAMYWTIARGFEEPLRGAMTPAAALLTTGVANLATLVPSSPGYVGTFEAGVALAVNGALDVPRGLALSYAIVVHAALWLPITAIGAVEWWRQHLALSRSRVAASTIDRDAPRLDRAGAVAVERSRGGGDIHS